MSDFEKFTPDGEWVSPVLQVGEYQLTYDNTQMIFFGDEWDFMNHVEYMGENGKMGMIVTTDIMDTLMENDYPYKFSPFPTQPDMDWYMKLELRNLESELENIDGTS